jgi:copper chaperone CopZ
MKKILWLIAFVFAAGRLSAQKNIAIDTIKTSTVCGTCKKTIEDGLRFEKGVIRVTVDYEHQLIILKYQQNKTNKELLKKAIVGLGYAADELLADPTAFEHLPECCKNTEKHH